MLETNKNIKDSNTCSSSDQREGEGSTAQGRKGAWL